MGVSKNNWYPQIIHSNRVFHYKPSILGYPYFWETSIYVFTYSNCGNMVIRQNYNILEHVTISTNILIHLILVGGFNPYEKYESKLDRFPK